MKKMILAAVAASLMLPGAAAFADPPPWAPAHGYREKRHHDSRIYDSRGRYYRPHRLSRNDRIWRGRDGHYYCRRDNGTTGLVIGAAVGALMGHELAGRGDQTLGVIIGAAGGGLLGRAIDRGDLQCR